MENANYRSVHVGDPCVEEEGCGVNDADAAGSEMHSTGSIATVDTYLQEEEL